MSALEAMALLSQLLYSSTTSLVVVVGIKRRPCQAERWEHKITVVSGSVMAVCLVVGIGMSLLVLFNSTVTYLKRVLTLHAVPQSRESVSFIYKKY